MTENKIHPLCPICSQSMCSGTLYAPGSHSVYWLPEHASLQCFVLTKQHIENAGGFVLGQTRASFVAKDRPHTFFCKTCRILLTQLD